MGKIKSLIKKILYFFKRLFLKHKHFTIISNNCWGGIMYQKFGMKYESPTIGLVIPPDDYNKFISNLEFYLSKDVEILNLSDAKHQHLFKALENKHGSLVYGKIHDIEICFLHYETFEVAKEKWDKRVGRISKNIIFKNNDNNLMTNEDFNEWNLFASNHNSIFISCNKMWIKNSKAKLTIYSEEQIPDCKNWVWDISQTTKPIKIINKLLE